MATADEIRRLRDYERLLGRVTAQATRFDRSNLARVRGRFRTFVREAGRLIPGNYELNQATIPAILNALATPLDRLSSGLADDLRAGFAFREEAAEEMARVFGRTFEIGGASASLPLAAVSPEIFDASFDYSARLIEWRHGGLVASIQRDVDQALRRSILGLEGRTFNATAAISSILGAGKGWTYRAERIVRTETLRFFSIATEASFRTFADSAGAKNLKARWYWSGISRPEHAAIHGQTIPWGGFFRVPTVDGRVVFIRYPRAVTDREGRLVPGHVSINCGCWHAPIPATLAKEITVPRRDAPRANYSRGRSRAA